MAAFPRSNKVLSLPDVRPFEVDGARGSRSARTARATSIRTGVLLVGTPATVRQITAQLSAMERPPVIAGAILIGAAGPVSLSVPVLGTIDELPVLVPRFGLKMAIVCLPSDIQGEGVRGLIRAAGIPVRVLPAIEDLLIPGIESPTHGTQELDSSRSPAAAHRFAGAAPLIDLGQLIGRTPYEMDRDAVAAVLRGKRVLITGAGGSIGAELARVAAAFDPALLILMERSENALFEIDRQIATHFPSVKRRAVLHDVVDVDGTLRLCADIRPDAVFHAAAHKHVPLMEDHPAHAVTNNLFGTRSIADAAIACGAERFVMISSDKAVNPTSVMGATKRLAEMYVRGLGEKSNSDKAVGRTRLSMVRFGNVLGSSASVLTIWAQQIAEGGPLTITDPRMTRYFMTIPEAATLVIQSTTLDASASDMAGRAPLGAHHSVGVFVLDMGDPIRIVDLAARFARAHGLQPRIRAETAGTLRHELIDRLPKTTPGAPTIDLVFNGMRPGEKIHEELAYAAEQLRPTAHPGIRAWAGPGFDSATASRMRQMVADLQAVRSSQDLGAVLAAIRRHVPEMRPAPMGTGYSDAAQTVHPNVG